MTNTTEIAGAASGAARGRGEVLIWDAPVRVFHWLFALSFAGAYITSGSESWRLVHVTLGYTMAALLLFRLAWGLIGTRHARFRNFVRGPGAIVDYLRSMLQGRPAHYAGHNPAGAAAIVALLALCAATTLFGWATYNDLGGEWLAQVHAVLGNTMLAVVGVHVTGVVIGSWLHRENLVAAMLTGRKSAQAQEAVPGTRRIVAALLVAAVIGFWVFQWRSAPARTDAIHATADEQHQNGRQ